MTKKIIRVSVVQQLTSRISEIITQPQYSVHTIKMGHFPAFINLSQNPQTGSEKCTCLGKPGRYATPVAVAKKAVLSYVFSKKHQLCSSKQQADSVCVNSWKG